MCNLYACNAVNQGPGNERVWENRQFVVIDRLKGSVNPQGDVSMVTFFLSTLLHSHPHRRVQENGFSEISEGPAH